MVHHPLRLTIITFFADNLVSGLNSNSWPWLILQLKQDIATATYIDESTPPCGLSPTQRETPSLYNSRFPPRRPQSPVPHLLQSLLLAYLLAASQVHVANLAINHPAACSLSSCPPSSPGRHSSPTPLGYLLCGGLGPRSHLPLAARPGWPPTSLQALLLTGHRAWLHGIGHHAYLGGSVSL